MPGLEYTRKSGRTIGSHGVATHQQATTIHPRHISDSHPRTEMRAPASSEPSQQTNPPTAETTNSRWPQVQGRGEDVLDKIPRLFRLVDLIQEDGPDGIVDKTIVDQHSVQRLLNTIRPGSCPSLTEIHFEGLDNLSIKPLGVYGDRNEIVNLLQRTGCLNDSSAGLVLGQKAKDGHPNSLLPGLYLALRPEEHGGQVKNAYIIYWPEVTTWDDRAASPSVRHNRTTFMRYLTRATNQVLLLVSSRQARVLNSGTGGLSIERVGDYNSHPLAPEEASSVDNQIMETCSARPGFKVPIDPSLIPESSRIQLVPGRHNIGLLVAEREFQAYRSNRYSIYPLKINESEKSFSSVVGGHLSQPTVDNQCKFEFSLPLDRSIEFIQLVRDKCLIAISGQGKTKIYIQDHLTIDHAVNETDGKRTLHHASMGGPECKFAFDEAVRLLAVVYGNKKDQKLSTYVFDENFTDLNIQNSPVSLKAWSCKPAKITKISIIPSSQEICLVDTSGCIHIYSLINRQPCLGHYQIGQSTPNALTNPEYPCLFTIATRERALGVHGPLSVQQESTQELVAKDGAFVTEVTCSDVHRVISKLGTNTTYLISFERDYQTVSSMILKVEKTGLSLLRQDGLQQPCNSLFDCHLHVWIRYPVVPLEGMTIPPGRCEPKEITLVSPTPLTEAQVYFSDLKSKLRLIMPKASIESLPSLVIPIFRKDDLYGYPQNSKVSCFKLGLYVQEIFSLVPLNLVNARGDQFNLMKDGVWGSEHNISSSCSDLARMVDMLSLGWYEPLFRFHSASKPVRVVSSIGERGVGKTYSLDHLANTSFGACAGRNGQGVWLSCTLTESYLLVALDFKGVHPMEQNNEASALMGLLSAAVSSLVILRDNYTITYHPNELVTRLGLLMRFIDPDKNSQLFGSTLSIAIKDVSDPNAYAASQNFAYDIHKLINEAGEKSAIPSLYRGGIQVIAWPSINAADFYATLAHFHTKLLERQPICINSSTFLHNLKVLIAKIKIRDWAPLDQSLASYRGGKLLEYLPIALSSGRGPTGPLKNMQTNESLFALHDHSNFTFWVPALDSNDSDGSQSEQALAARALAMENLVEKYGTDLESRQRMLDTDYIKTTQKGIHDLLEQRLDFVQQWALVNTETFPQDNSHIREFFRELASAKATMRNATHICASQCDNCQLLCVRAYQHLGEHDCGTDHICIFDCEIFGPNERLEPCGLPAGHSEQHMCHAALADPTVLRAPKSRFITHKEPNLAPKPHPCALRAIEQLRMKLDEETRKRRTLEEGNRNPGGVPHLGDASQTPRQMLSGGLALSCEAPSQSLNLHPRPDNL